MSVVHHPLGLDIDITVTLAHKGINTCCNVSYDVSSTSHHPQGLDITATLAHKGINACKLGCQWHITLRVLLGRI